MIKVNELTKFFGKRSAIENLTFNAKKGEILGFLGPNGAGKTTTMRILSGFIPPTSGTVEIAGFDLIEKSIEVRKRVGYLPETIPLYPEMTVHEYLTFMADLRSIKEPEKQIKQVLEKVNLIDREKGYIGNLSKGMRQRLGLAQAIIHNPDVLVLDEPTIGLDPAQIIEVRNLIREIGQQHTVLLSTHILSEAEQLCDRVLIINKGHIVAEDTPERLQSRLIGAQRVVLTIGGDSDGFEEIVKNVPGVNFTHKSGYGSLEFESLPGQDARASVARALIQEGYELLELRSIGVSLEDIFLQLTRDEPAPPATVDHVVEDDLAEIA
jgi:ABC-2 type transport system ATP-binding protein